MKTKLFQNITEEEQQGLIKCSFAVEKKFKHGQYIFRLGDKVQKMYLIKKGDVMIAREYASGKRNVLFTVHEGECFCEPFSYNDEMLCWSDAIAVDDVTVLEIPWEFFHGFCKKACVSHQKLVRNMLEIVSEKNYKTIRKVYLLSGKTIRERIAMWILVGTRGRDSFTSSMNKEELADFLGTTRPSLSRELLKMKAEGLLDYEKRHYRILNRKEIENLAEL